MSVLLVFVDGVGVGPRNQSSNPMARVETLLSHFEDGSGTELPPDAALARIDACLGVPGRPQSATGQATIYTGVNAAAHLGRHCVGFPNRELRQLLYRESIFRKVRSTGGRATFANAYPRPVLSLLDLPYEGAQVPPLEADRHTRRRIGLSASTCAATGNGPFRTLEQAESGLALTHDITGSSDQRHSFPLPRRSPQEAADILLKLMASHAFVLFEHFLLDAAGHARDMERAASLLSEVDAFLRALAAGLGRGDHLLVVSDHGNCEDLTVRSHTRNPVPLVVFGSRAKEVASSARDLTDIAPSILALAGHEKRGAHDVAEA